MPSWALASAGRWSARYKSKAENACSVKYLVIPSLSVRGLISRLRMQQVMTCVRFKDELESSQSCEAVTHCTSYIKSKSLRVGSPELSLDDPHAADHRLVFM